MTNLNGWIWKIARLIAAVVLLGGAAVGCEDKNQAAATPEGEAVAAGADTAAPAAAAPAAKFAAQAKVEITPDNAESKADELAKEIEADLAAE